MTKKRTTPHKHGRLAIESEITPEMRAEEEIKRFSMLYGRTCGIIRMDRLYSLYQQARPETDISEKDFLGILSGASIPDWHCPAEIYWEHDDIPYCIDTGLSDGGVYNGMWLNAKHAGFNSEEEYQQGFIDLDKNWKETAQDLEEYRVRLIGLQRGKPVKAIADPLSYRFSDELIWRIPALTKLKEDSLTLRRIPKKDLDYRAYRVEDAIKRTAYHISDWGIPDEDMLTEYAKTLLIYLGIIDYTEDEVEQAASMWARASIQIPLWSLNGYSASELTSAGSEALRDAA